MRILHVSHAVPPEGRTGVENYTASLARAQAAAGHTVAVYARGHRADVPAGLEERTEEGGYLTVRAHFGPGHQFRHFRTRWDRNDAFRRFVGAWEPDVVHFQHLMYHSLDYVALARAAGAATLLTLHDFWFTCPAVQRLDYAGRLCDRAPGAGCLPCLWGGRRAALLPPGRLAAWLQKPALGRALTLLPTLDELEDWGESSRRCLAAVDVLVSPSHFLADDVRRHAAGEAGPVVISDYGIPRPEAAPVAPRVVDGVDRVSGADGRPPAPLRFGVIGTHRIKGVAVAVEAFRRLPEGFPARLIVYGPPAAEAGASLPPNVESGGAFGAEDIERVYNSFDVLIVPSVWYENAPFVIREAFARGKPVVASDIGGMAESVRDGVDGLHFPVGDADALAARVRRLVEDSALLPALRAGIRPPKFYDEHLTELDGLYARAYERRHGRAWAPRREPKAAA